jgi:hypothetical protein
MISKRKITANRQNAAHSTGPRTDHGKARARNNAYKHGLAASVLADAALAQDVERVERALSTVGNELYNELATHNLARRALDLLRIRRVRAQMIDAGLGARANLLHQRQSQRNDELSLEVAFVTAMTNVLAQMQLLERYERRAFSRWRRIIWGTCKHRK